MNVSIVKQPGTILGLLVALGLPLVSACATQRSDTSSPQPAVTTPEKTGDLASQFGKTFYFHGEFQDQLSEALFVVREDEDRNWGEVVVINQSDRAFQVPDNVATPLWIYGTVEQLTQAELQKNNVPEADWPLYDGQPVVAAERITLAPPPNELVENADTFLNQHVTVYGKVEPVAADNTFILEDPRLFGGKGIILIQGANADLDKVVGSEKAVVSGVLRPYVIADLKQEWLNSCFEELG